MTSTSPCQKYAPTRGRTYAESWLLRFRTAANDTQREVIWAILNRCFSSVSVAIEVHHGTANATDTAAPYYAFPDGTGLTCEPAHRRVQPKRKSSAPVLPSWFARVDAEGTLVDATGVCHADDPLREWIEQPVTHAMNAPRLLDQIPRRVVFEAYSTACVVAVVSAVESETWDDRLIGIPLEYEFLEQWFVLRERHSTDVLAPIMSSLPILELQAGTEVTDRLLYSDTVEDVEVVNVKEVPPEAVMSGVWLRRAIKVHESGWQIPAEGEDNTYDTPPIPSELLDAALLAATRSDRLGDLLPRMLKLGPGVALDALESGLPPAGSGESRTGEFLAGLVSRLDFLPLLESEDPEIRERAQLILPRVRR